jgi:hypothetical protein
MTDLLEHGAAWLATQRQRHTTRPIMYVRDAAAVELRATPGRTTFEQVSEFGIVTRLESHDWLVQAADLVLAGQRVLPQGGRSDSCGRRRADVRVRGSGARRRAAVPLQRCVSAYVADSHQARGHGGPVMDEPTGSIGCGDGLCDDVVQLKAEVFGNGHPENSLRVRVGNVEKQLAVIKRLSWATAGGVGALVLRVISAWFEAHFVG